MSLETDDGVSRGACGNEGQMSLETDDGVSRVQVVTRDR